MFHFEIPYLTLLVLLSIYGAQRLWLVVELFARLKLGRVNRPSSHSNSLDAARDSEAVDTVLESSVLLQLPVFNDGNVFLRLLDSVRELDWPHDRLLVQVLDDSTDGSSDQIADRVAVLRDTGLRVEHLRRPARVGYKAGALADGLAKCDFPFVAMFDSDFVIPSDFLRRALVEFADERVAFVQGRWGFANESDSFLTKVQALMLDGHFAIEHRVRALAGRFFNFNGTAGVWRRAAIDDAGGWTSDSITEDLDLSLRAWLAGWEFCYLDDLIAMSDLPVRMSAYRTQQNRWISGSIQTAMTYLPKILSSPVSYTRRLDLLLAITGNLCYPLIVALAFALPHAIAIRLVQRDALLLYADLPFFLFATGSVALFYWCARGSRTTLVTLVRIPVLMALGMGMTLHNSRAVLRGVTGSARVFERTPKGDGGGTTSSTRKGGLQWLEAGMLLYLLSIVFYAAPVALYSLPLIGLLALGYGLVLLAQRPLKER